MNDDLISRKAAIDLLWKALFEYEDKTEKQFIESDDLDVGDWVGQYRVFVQNMSDIDRRVIMNMPAAQFQRLTIDGVTLYRCDPAKNTVCSKTSCFVDGGPCYLTKHKDFEKTEGGTDAAD